MLNFNNVSRRSSLEVHYPWPKLADWLRLGKNGFISEYFGLNSPMYKFYVDSTRETHWVPVIFSEIDLKNQFKFVHLKNIP